MVLLRASHPPAGATTLIVSLGMVTRPRDLAILWLAILWRRPTTRDSAGNRRTTSGGRPFSCLVGAAFLRSLFLGRSRLAGRGRFVAAARRHRAGAARRAADRFALRRLEIDIPVVACGRSISSRRVRGCRWGRSLADDQPSHCTRPRSPIRAAIAAPSAVPPSSPQVSLHTPALFTNREDGEVRQAGAACFR